LLCPSVLGNRPPCRLSWRLHGGAGASSARSLGLDDGITLAATQRHMIAEKSAIETQEKRDQTSTGPGIKLLASNVNTYRAINRAAPGGSVPVGEGRAKSKAKRARGAAAVNAMEEEEEGEVDGGDGRAT
ncbi:unnamed protein product, partial [Ectocarpus fasciculatus]